MTRPGVSLALAGSVDLRAATTRFSRIGTLTPPTTSTPPICCSRTASEMTPIPTKSSTSERAAISALTRHCATKSARVGETDHQYHGRPQEGACRYRGVATKDVGPHPISDTGTERQTQQPAGAGPTVGNLGSAHHPRRNPVGYRHIARLACHYPGIDRAAPPPALHWMEGGRVLEKNLAARASVVLQMLSPL